MRQRQRDELRGPQRLPDGPLHFRRVGSAARRCCGLRRRTHQERRRDQQRPGRDADHQHRRAPVIGRDQPACERRDRQRRHAHAGRHQRHRKAAAMFDPGARHRDHRRIETAGSNPDQHAEEKLELPEAGGLARADQADAEQHRAGQNHDAGAEPVGQCAPEERRESHGEEIDRRRRRDAADRPARIRRNRLQEHGQRQHRAEADTGHQRAGADDDPAIGEIGEPDWEKPAGLLMRFLALVMFFDRGTMVTYPAAGQGGGRMAASVFATHRRAARSTLRAATAVPDGRWCLGPAWADAAAL